MAEILIIDDNEALCRTLIRKLERATPHRAQAVHTLAQGLERVNAQPFDLVFLDVIMPDGNGLNLIPAIKDAPGAPEVIIITGKGEREGAVLAIQNGAWDYVQKGSSLESIILPMARALQYREEKLKKQLPLSLKRERIIGKSPALMDCLDLLAQAAASDANLLIVGETGVGKELFARALHENGRRKDNKFVVLDCAATPENLIESILFGYEKGAFTGADRAKDGLVKEADRGALFLDEIGELPLSFQRVFLRVLQERSFRPLGSAKESKSDFRLITATNRDLPAMVENGLFRQDLLFRVNTIVLKIPPLRERKQDCAELARHYIDSICQRMALAAKGYTPEFMDALIAHDWPGNVRELIHALERAIVMAGNEAILFPQFLPAGIRIKGLDATLPEKSPPTSPAPPPPSPPTPDENPPLEPAPALPSYKQFRRPRLDAIERQYLELLLARADQEMDEAARLSGLSKSMLYKLMKKHQIKR